MLRRKHFFILYLLIFAAFTNLSTFTVERFGIPLLPILFIFAALTLLFEMLTARAYTLINYREPATYAVNFFFLIFITAGLINADLEKAFRLEIYLLLTGFLTFHLILLYVQKIEELEGILAIVLLCGPLLVAQGAYQFYQDISTASLDYNIRAAGWWTDPNAYACVLSLIYLVSFYFVDKKRAALSLAGCATQLLTALGVVISLSRGGILVFALISLLYWQTFWKYKVRYALLLLGVSAVCIVCFSFLDVEALKNVPFKRLLLSEQNVPDFTSSRLDAAIGGLLIYAQHPLIGAGFGNLLYYAEVLNYLKAYTHNLFIEILAVSGPLPLISFLFMLGYLYHSLPRRAGAASTMGKVLARFILALAAMGPFAHYLLYMKPVWVLLSLLPIYSQLTRGKTDAPGHDHHKI